MDDELATLHPTYNRLGWIEGLVLKGGKIHRKTAEEVRVLLLSPIQPIGEVRLIDCYPLGDDEKEILKEAFSRATAVTADISTAAKLSTFSGPFTDTDAVPVRSLSLTFKNISMEQQIDMLECVFDSVPPTLTGKRTIEHLSILGVFLESNLLSRVNTWAHQVDVRGLEIDHSIVALEMYKGVPTKPRRITIRGEDMNDTDLAALFEWDQLEGLEFIDCRFTNFVGIKNLKNLRSLVLSGGFFHTPAGSNSTVTSVGDKLVTGLCHLMQATNSSFHELHIHNVVGFRSPHLQSIINFLGDNESSLKVLYAGIYGTPAHFEHSEKLIQVLTTFNTSLESVFFQFKSRMNKLLLPLTFRNLAGRKLLKGGDGNVIIPWSNVLARIQKLKPRTKKGFELLPEEICVLRIDATFHLLCGSVGELF